VNGAYGKTDNLCVFELYKVGGVDILIHTTQQLYRSQACLKSISCHGVLRLFVYLHIYTSKGLIYSTIIKSRLHISYCYTIIIALKRNSNALSDHT
jgi:hypothetical protein